MGQTPSVDSCVGGFSTLIAAPLISSFFGYHVTSMPDFIADDDDDPDTIPERVKALGKDNYEATMVTVGGKEEHGWKLKPEAPDTCNVWKHGWCWGEGGDFDRDRNRYDREIKNKVDKDKAARKTERE